MKTYSSVQLHRKSIISEKVHLVPSALDVTSEIETLLSCYWKIPGGSVNHRRCVHLFSSYFSAISPRRSSSYRRGLLFNWWPLHVDDRQCVCHLVSGLCPPLLLVALLMLTPAQLPSQGGPHKLAVSCHQGQDDHVVHDDLELADH